MFSPITMFGLPFDASLEQYWVPQSKMISKEHQLAYKRFGQLMKAQWSSGSSIRNYFPPTPIDVLAYDYFGYTLNHFPNLGEIKHQLLDMFYEQADKLLTGPKVTNTKVAERVMTLHVGFYYEEFKHYAVENPERYKTLWFYKTLNAITTKHWDVLQQEHDITGLTPQEVVHLLLPERSVLFLSICELMACSLSRFPEHDDEKHLASIFMSLHQQRNISQAILAAWLLALKTSDELYLIILSEFIDVVTTKAGHLVNLQILTAFHQAIRQENSHVTPFDNYVKFLPVICEAELIVDQPDSKAYLSYMQLLLQMHNPRLNPEQLLIDRLNLTIQSFATEAKIDKDRFFHFTKELRLPITTLIHIFEIMGNQIVGVVLNELLPLESRKEALDQQILAIHENSLLLAKNPLDNLNELQTLKQQLNEVTESRQEAEQRSNDKREQAITRYNDMVESIIAEFDNSAKQHEVESMKRQLKDMADENEALRKDMALLKEKPLKLAIPLQPTSESMKDFTQDESLEDAIFVLADKNPIVAFVSLIAAKRPWVKLSSSLLKQLDEVKNFSRQQELFKHLDKLTSREFMETYNQYGSEGTFNYFTRIQLSYKESDTTMGHGRYRAEREFVFDFNGQQKRILCEPHLRFGVNNKAQDQLRIHFAIEDGRLYLGYLGRHLSTGA